MTALVFGARDTAYADAAREARKPRLTEPAKLAQQAPKQRAGSTDHLLVDRETGDVSLEFRLKLAPAAQHRGAPVTFLLSPEDTTRRDAPALGRIDLGRPGDPKRGRKKGRKLDGRQLELSEWVYSETDHKWRRESLSGLRFWPASDAEARNLRGQGIGIRTWHGRPLACRFEFRDSHVHFYFEGRLVQRWRRSDRPTGTSLLVRVGAADTVEGVSVRPLPTPGLYETVDLSRLADERLAQAVTVVSHVPFELARGGHYAVDLGKARWIDEQQNPSKFYADYDTGSPILNDPRMPMLTLPRADYVAAHLLAAAVSDTEHSSVTTLRVGRYGGRRQVVQRDYAAAIPAQEGQGFRTTRIPLIDVVAQDVLGDILDVELTKQVRLARHVPDPNRFRRRPLGLPSGVKLAAITFEKSPLQMRVVSGEPGNAFVEPRQPAFLVELENIAQSTQSFVLEGRARHLRGGTSDLRVVGEVQAGTKREVRLAVQPVRRGYHDLAVELKDASGQVLLRRRTSFAVLPPDQRKHRATSPFGTWDWYGTHVTSTDSDLVGSLYRKLGFRFGMSHHPLEARKRWGTVHGFQAKLDPALKKYETLRGKHPDLSPVVLQFHEHSISRRHAMRVPDLFTDSRAFELNAAEKNKYQKMLDEALQGATLLRSKYPEAKISFGNGVPATKEEFYRRGLPAAAFDFGGNEAGCFHRLPETQPPDFLSLNASLWMDRQLLDAYGYPGKGVYQSYEVCYPGDNPGNLSSDVQADYFVRHALHSLAWGMPFIHIGMLMDTGNSYYFSNWGASGFLRAVPEVNVKPAFVAMATLTQVLDGARFIKSHNTGSPSAYALEFRRADGQQVLAYWTVRGQRALRVTLDGSAWRAVDDQGNEAWVPEVVTARTFPQYLIGRGNVRAVDAQSAAFSSAPPTDGRAVTSLARFSEWRQLTGRNQELENYDFMTPRRKGNFDFSEVADCEGRGPALRVEPLAVAQGKDSMPMYERLALKQPVTLPGEPNEIGVWVNGNSGWGRVIFELRDARGERWVSLGAQADQPGKPISDWSTDDPYGHSAINFDGWRYVGFPLPGNYPGERHPWPANSNWRWNGDGVVQYPLRLVGVAVTARSKVLHVKDWSAPPRTEIYLGEVVAGSRASWLE